MSAPSSGHIGLVSNFPVRIRCGTTEMFKVSCGPAADVEVIGLSYDAEKDCMKLEFKMVCRECAQAEELP